MLQFYQSIPQHIDPIVFSIGFFSVRWYSLMYLIAFAVVYFLLNWRIRKGEKINELRITDYELRKLVIDVIFYSVLGVLIGGRLGYVLFYNFNYFIGHPLEVFLPINLDSCFIIHDSCLTGFYGMSYFGGLIGVILGLVILAKKNNISFWALADFVVPAVPAGYLFGRVGNFLNGELYGRATERIWGMYFPSDPTGLLRHPSQLYEAFFEGVVLFVILWLLRNMLRNKTGLLLIIYLFGYGFLRFFIEFFREPDLQIRLVFDFLTLGQIFSVSLILIAVCITLWRKNKKVV